MANGITINDGRATCDDCGRWEWANSGKQIRHSTRCDTPQAQLPSAAPTRKSSERPARPGQFSKESPGSGLTSDELYDAYRRGEISQSDAMNTDF